MSTITLEEAQTQLADLIHGLKPGDVVLITENELPVARLTVAAPRPSDRRLRRSGTLRGTVTFMASDFNGPLEDFKEYME